MRGLWIAIPAIAMSALTAVPSALLSSQPMLPDFGFDPWGAARGNDPAFVVAPGSRGFLDSLHTGPQIHVYNESTGHTTILDEVWLGHGSERFAVAEYDGRPSRDVSPERIRRVAIPHAFLFVRSASGGSYREGVVVDPGACRVQADDGSGFEVVLAPGEIAWVTVGASGVTIDERDAP